MAERGIIIGVDLGGTNFRIGGMSPEGRVSDVKIRPSAFIGEADSAIGALSGGIARYVDEAGINMDEVLCVSIGIPATVDKERKMGHSVPNITNSAGEHVLDGVNITDGIGDALGVVTFLNRDTNNLLAFDMLMNGLYGEEIVVGCYIGTGFGGSVHIYGRYLLGKNGVANEIGHIPYYKGEDYCSCGKKACTECYASGRVLKLIQEERYPDEDIAQIFVRHAKDPALVDFIYACALPIATEVNIFDPDCVVIGGGVVDMTGFPKDDLISQVIENVRKPLPADNLKIIYSRQCRDMGVIGAALYAMDCMGMQFDPNIADRIRQSAF